MELMARYPDGHFDLAIVDPPYGIDVANMNMGIGKSKKASKAKNKKWQKNIGMLINRMKFFLPSCLEYLKIKLFGAEIILICQHLIILLFGIKKFHLVYLFQIVSLRGHPLIDRKKFLDILFI